MIISYTGDSFLSRRAARATLGKLGFGPGAVTELGEGMSAQSVSELASQGA